jgi:hypothetical protein
MTEERSNEEIRADQRLLVAYATTEEKREARSRLVADSWSLLDRLAAAEREAAERGAEIEALKATRCLSGNHYLAEDPRPRIAAVKARAEAAEARLAAVEKIADEIDRRWDSWWARQIRAALAAPVSPQPEPTEAYHWRDNGALLPDEIQPEPPTEPATCAEHRQSGPHGYYADGSCDLLQCPGPLSEEGR